MHLLCRLPFTSPHEEPPGCVAAEVCRARGYTYQANTPWSTLRAYLCSLSAPTVSTDSNLWTSDDLRYVARYVNGQCAWPRSRLVAAFHFLQSFLAPSADPALLLPVSWASGQQSPECPELLNCSALYSICLHHGIKLSPATTAADMERIVHLLTENSEVLQYQAHSLLHRLTNQQIISFLLQNTPAPESTSSVLSYSGCPGTHISYDSLVSVYTHFHDLPTLQSKFTPFSEHGAVALAAFLYKIDLSRAAFPIREYRTLMNCGRSAYQPADLWMRYWYARNPALFDLNRTFNPLFPPQFYGAECLESLASENGLLTIPGNAYQQLQENYLLDNFHSGEMPNISSRTTCIELLELEEIEPGELLAYGPASGPLVILSMRELSNLFRANRSFATPFREQGMFSVPAINKLRNIASSLLGPSPGTGLSGEVLAQRQELLEAIRRVEIFTRRGDEGSRTLLTWYEGASNTEKQNLLGVLQKVLHAGMYMRGWRGEGAPYPLSKTGSTPEYQIQMGILITDLLGKLQEDWRTPAGRIIANLPLVCFRNGDYRFCTKENSLTIGERIALVAVGENSREVDSCIRISSNWLCASAHKYLGVVGASVPFPIGELRDIQ